MLSKHTYTDVKEIYLLRESEAPLFKSHHRIFLGIFSAKQHQTLITGSRTVSVHNHADQNRYSEPDCDVSRTPTRWFNWPEPKQSVVEVVEVQLQQM